MSGYILVSQDLRLLHQQGQIGNVASFEDQVQPASFDLCLSDEGYEVKSSFLPGCNHTVAQVLKEHGGKKFTIKQDTVLKQGQVYIVPLREKLKLSQDLYGLFNPKSSTGRLDVFARTVGDYSERFDHVPEGYEGPLYLELYSSSFDIAISPGLSLNQLRVQRGYNVHLSPEEMLKLQSHADVENTDYYDCNRGLTFLLSLENGEEPVGYRSKHSSEPINLRYLSHYAIDDFWQPIYGERGELIIEPGGFYILKSHNNAFVPSYCAGHMLPYDIEAGEFRVHYAGFFDPGFGCRQANGLHAKAIMEVRCRDVPFLLRDRQVIGRLIYQRLRTTPDVLYGTPKSNYQGQQLRLSKHFKQDNRP